MTWYLSCFGSAVRLVVRVTCCVWYFEGEEHNNGGNNYDYTNNYSSYFEMTLHNRNNENKNSISSYIQKEIEIKLSLIFIFRKYYFFIISLRKIQNVIRPSTTQSNKNNGYVILGF